MTNKLLIEWWFPLSSHKNRVKISITVDLREANWRFYNNYAPARERRRLKLSNLAKFTSEPWRGTSANSCVCDKALADQIVDGRHTKDSIQDRLSPSLTEAALLSYSRHLCAWKCGNRVALTWGTRPINYRRRSSTYPAERSSYVIC